MCSQPLTFHWVVVSLQVLQCLAGFECFPNRVLLKDRGRLTNGRHLQVQLAPQLNGGRKTDRNSGPVFSSRLVWAAGWSGQQTGLVGRLVWSASTTDDFYCCDQTILPRRLNEPAAAPNQSVVLAAASRRAARWAALIALIANNEDKSKNESKVHMF